VESREKKGKKGISDIRLYEGKKMKEDEGKADE
jgi:hypothetical protein